MLDLENDKEGKNGRRQATFDFDDEEICSDEFL